MILNFKFNLILCATLLTGMAQAQIQIGSDIDGEAAGDNFGHSVAISADGNRMAIGAPQNDGAGSDAGHVRLYDWSGGAWVQVGADIEGEGIGDEAGWEVALSADGNRVAVGAPFNNGTGSVAGHVRIYEWNGSAWVQVGADIDGEAMANFFGSAISLSTDGNRVAIGAAFNDGAGTNAGHVRIYEWNGSAWVQVGTDLDGGAAHDQFGTSVALSANGNRVAAGATLNSGTPSGAGYVRLYDWNGSFWVQVGTDINGEAVGDLFGRSVALSSTGTRVAIGASYNDGSGSNAGHVRLYDWNGSAWVQVGTDIDGEAAEDFSGRRVALSADGNRVAIGAQWNDGAGEKAGHVRLYDWNGSNWVQAGADIDGEAADDEFGSSVALSANGDRVASGAIYNDGTGTDAGHVRVYSFCTSAICDDGDPCTDDICDPVLGCLNNPLPDADGDGICDAEDSCPALFGEIGDPCDDGIPCTENDMIDASCECHGTPNNTLCNDGSACTVDSCDPVLGCQNVPVDCDDGDPCTTDSCDPVLGCVNTPVPDADGDGICDTEDSCPALFGEIGDPCDDGIACTENDMIDAACECHGTPNDSLCDDGIACTTDSCDPDLGCVYTNICVPANNECASAQPLSVPTFPSSSSTLGTLYGATNSSGAACAGSAGGGDVFYTFTLASENHVGITVNPFAGADVVVEVLDACAGTSIACIDNAGAGSSESELLENLASGTYTVRVHNAGGSPEPEGSASFLINVQQMPYAQVQDSPISTLYACNQTNFQLEDFVGASPQTTSWVLDYQWLTAEEGGGAQTVYQRGYANYVARCEWLGMEYGKTYNVFVRVLIDHPVFGPTWGVYQGDFQNPNLPGASVCTISTASSVTPTELRPNYTPTNALGNDYSLCDFAIAYNVSGSENFRWRFDGNGTPGDAEDIIYTRGSGNPGVRLNWVNGLVPGLTYNVAVEVQVAGQWSGYSTVLPLTLALTPNDVEIRSSFCGGTYAPNGYLLSESVCDADLYQFRFTPTGGGTPRYRNSSNYVCFMSAANPALTPGDYDVQVKVTQNGVPGDWGPACTITISGPQGQENETPSLRDIEATGSATLFPNPNAGTEVRVNLDGLSNGSHEVMIQVYDVYGKLISTEWFGNEGTQLSRLVRFDGNLAMGMYMVQITVDGERFATERLIIK